jgi:hypothetical protein
VRIRRAVRMGARALNCWQATNASSSLSVTSDISATFGRGKSLYTDRLGGCEAWLVWPQTVPRAAEKGLSVLSEGAWEGAAQAATQPKRLS